jgi:tetratricopeptide (TPR) repeat protein
VSLEHTPAPRAIVADGQAADLSTHADLGIAYKEMGLYDAAITEFKLLTQDPRREVFALTMMGECFEAKGSITEAVIRYKRALNCDDVSETENLDLYFLLGCAFERLGDVGEALYFFEKVAKRDAKFREVDRKLTDLKPRMARRA